MSVAEQEVQRKGYVEAFLDPVVLQAIRAGGPRQAVAIAYLEWAGSNHQRVVIPWTVVRDTTGLQRLAAALAEAPMETGAGTSISNGLLFAWRLLHRLPFRSSRFVIDISGDGLNNSGPSVTDVRDLLVAGGVTINGLPISLRRGAPDRFERFGEEYLAAYFEACVVGGAGAFTIGVDDIAEMGLAIKMKLVREIVGYDRDLGGMVHPVGYFLVSDCRTPGMEQGR